LLDTNEAIYRQYETLGISKKVLDFGTSVEKELKERFDKIDTNAEYNQLKVIAAMQKNKVSAECFQASSGYGYNDLGRDTLERVYADCIWHQLYDQPQNHWCCSCPNRGNTCPNPCLHSDR
jgi:hypothetical protein